MTGCNRCSYNYQLKSSAHNPTGQCLEVQSTSYNAMTNHLRRILMAKSVVDSGKSRKRVPISRRDVKLRMVKTPVTKQRRSDIDSNSKVNLSLSQNEFDRLVYDTKYHPNEMASLTCRRSRNRTSSSNYDRKKGDRSNSTDSSDDYVLGGNRESLRYYGTSMSEDFEDTKKFGKPDSQVYLPRAKSSPEEIPDFLASLLSGTRLTSDFTDVVNPKGIDEDVPTYVKFVYDITKEVMDRRLYSDSEIERVFQKHFKRNSGTLDKRKMKREINQLKRSLDMKYDSDEVEDEDEEDEAAGSREFADRSSEIKIFEKYQRDSKKLDPRFSAIEENQEDSSPREMLTVTKEEILKTLLDLDLNPAKAREICDGLQHRSSPGIPGTENRSDVNGLRDPGSRNKETGKVPDSDESEAERNRKKSKGICCDAGSDSSEHNRTRFESGSSEFPVSNEDLETDSSNGRKEIIEKVEKVDESDTSRSTSTAKDSGSKSTAGNGIDVASGAQGNPTANFEHEAKSRENLGGGNLSRENSIPEEE